MQELYNDLTSFKYAPEPLQEAKLPKDGGDFRPIAISCVKDKIVQNALSGALSPYFDNTFSNASYAYRKGKSHINAINRTRDYISQGYLYILKSDVENFFETINHDELLNLLTKKILDKRIIRLISLLLQNGLFLKQNYREHHIGVHQGDSLSPLLSNIYLDQMDSFLQNKKAIHVRYADDFVVLAKTQEELEKYKEALNKFLPTIKLKLKEEKTKIVQADVGFTFLGASFKGATLSIDNETLQKTESKLIKLAKQKTAFDKYIVELNFLIDGFKRYLLQIVKEDSPQISRLESAIIDSIASKIYNCKTYNAKTSKAVFKEELQKLTALTSKASTGAAINLAIAKGYEKFESEKSVKAPIAAIEKKKREYAEEFAKSSTLFIAKPGTFLGIAKFSFVVKEAGKVIKTAPINQIKHIIISSAYSSLSSKVVEVCAKNSIGIDFMEDKTGIYAQLTSFNAAISKNYFLQLGLIAKNEHIVLAKDFIEGKAKNQLNYLKYMNRYHENLDAHILKIENSLKRFKIANVVQTSIMGYEGEMAATYWDAIKILLGENVFSGRITQGAKDPINSALNYGYAILYGRAQKALLKAGLALNISFLHAIDGRKPTLTFDFVEEFRAYIVDKTVVSLASKSDVIKTDKDGLLMQNAKKELTEALLERLGGYVTWKKESRKMDDIIESQAYLLARHVNGEDRYSPFIGKY